MYREHTQIYKGLILMYIMYNQIPQKLNLRRERIHKIVEWIGKEEESKIDKKKLRIKIMSRFEIHRHKETMK